MSVSLVGSIGSEGTSMYQYQSAVLEQESFQNILQNAVDTGSEEEIKEACYEFEAYFLNLMLSTMRNTINYDDGIFARSDAEETFQDMLDEEVTKNLASSGGVGLADMMYNQLTAPMVSTNINMDFSI
ncbi:MAG: rod-binding protein [bacterium]